MTANLIDFLNARLDEDQLLLEQMTGGALIQGYLRHKGDQLKADIEAKRAIISEHLALSRDFVHFNQTVVEHTRQATLDEVLELLARAYASHPDYRAEWRL